MASANIKANGMNVILDTALWAGQGGITKLTEAGAVSNAGDVSWLQSPIGTGTAMSTCRLAIVDITLAAGNTNTTFDVAAEVLETSSNTPNPLFDANATFELVGVLSVLNIDEPTGAMAQGEHKVTQIKLLADAQAAANNRMRVTFLYRRAL